MNFTSKIKDLKSIAEIDGYWSDADYINLLEALDFSDAKDANPSELRELLEMAISDFEPHESAEVLLRYKLKDKLSEGQIRNLSHELADDNEAEDNPDIALHYPLFNINQLLHRSFNGIFPYAKATQLEIELKFKADENIAVSKEPVLKAISYGLSDNSPIKRLFENQLNGKEAFPEAEKIVWELHQRGADTYTVITSDYWINKEDIIKYEFAGSIKQFAVKL